MYLFVGASLGGGNSYGWIKNYINSRIGKPISFKKLNDLAEKIKPGSNGLRFCTGPTRVCPERSHGFYGNMNLKGDSGHMARAVMEGVLFDLYNFYTLIGKTSGDIIIGSGNGLSRNKVWPHIVADMFGLELRITNFENAVFGAAIMAAKGTGLISDFIRIFGSFKYKEIRPDKSNHRKYEKLLNDNSF